MTKNRLTHRQIKRQKKNQAERLSRAEEGHSLEQPGLLVAHYGTTLIVENASGQLFKCKLRQNLGTLVTGDNVIWQPIDEHTGIVVACCDRHSVITKPYKHTTKPVVANVDRMIVVLALAPIPQATTLDRYLVVAHHLQLPVTVVINKWDLFSSPQHDALANRIEAYTKLGIPFIKVSNKTKIGLDELRAQLNHNTSILVGQSGVGKSSLLTTLIPDAKVTVQTLSHNERLGRQTTTATRLFHLPEGGNIIDSPGIHQFKVLHLSKADILESYTEFAPFLGQCQFRNCEHQSEPGCALLAAIKNQQIPAFRLENYHALLADRTEK